MFTGFTDATVDFLWGIRFNNERPWFEAHKETYLSELYRPMKDLGAEIYDFLSEQRPEDPMVCRVSRIYRDARRLHGRGPYKDHLWFCVERPAEDWTTRPTFWFELGPDYWGYGMGCWMARPMDMAKLRSRIVRDPKPMEKLTKALRGQTEFTLGGDTYKRPKAGAPSELLAPWFQMKTISITHSESYRTRLTYNSWGRSYKLEMYNRSKKAYENTVDELTGKQLTFDNVVVCFADIAAYAGDSHDVQSVNYVAGGQAYLFTRGGVQVGRWEKPHPTHPLKLYTETGEEMTLNRGKTYLALVDNDEWSNFSY